MSASNDTASFFSLPLLLFPKRHAGKPAWENVIVVKMRSNLLWRSVNAVTCRHVCRRLVGQVVKVELPTCLIDNGGFVFRPAWEGAPDWFFVFVGKRLGTSDRGFLCVKVGHVECAARHATLESGLKLETNSGFTR